MHDHALVPDLAATQFSTTTEETTEATTVTTEETTMRLFIETPLGKQF